MTTDTTSIDTVIQPPSVAEYLKLRREGELRAFSPEAAEIGLKGTLFAVTLRHENEAIGMGRIVGDGGCFVQIVDIAVDPRFRGKGLGKRIMASLMEWAKNELPETTFLSLFADIPADKLYAQFGFTETAPKSLGMSCRVTRT
ncbi:GNAT family N-acetyltransferase [Shimia sp.]|uniref:GNAT family N-acetyltransferase n=1 Tax=Shimia sp. TaxID=1954381 RepID=UPI0032981131